MVHRVVSGGQTGVDRAALDAAMAVGLPVGGWCPAGRRAEDGPIDPRYPLRETEAVGYRMRTRFNVRDSDGTLIVAPAELTGGTAYTVACAERFERPCHHLVVDAAGQPDASPDLDAVAEWLRAHQIRVLNVAGPRESTVPGIYASARTVLSALFVRVLAESKL